MKLTVEEKEVNENDKFPMLMSTRDKTHIFYIIAKGQDSEYPECYSGICLQSTNKIDKYAFSKCWDRNLVEFKGKITLEND